MPVAQKILEVMKRLDYLKKDKQIEGGGNYRFLSDEKVAGECHKHCTEVGLIMFPVNTELLEGREDKTRNDYVLHNLRTVITYRFVDPTDDTFVDVPVFGEASDGGDKVCNKCMTAARKYALIQTFMLSSGDDPDDIPSGEVSESKKEQPSQPRPAAQGKPTVANPDEPASEKQYDLITKLLNEKQVAQKYAADIRAELRTMKKGRASQVIGELMNIPNIPAATAEQDVKDLFAGEEEPISDVFGGE